jgi:hypothetical protein
VNPDDESFIERKAKTTSRSRRSCSRS